MEINSVANQEMYTMLQQSQQQKLDLTTKMLKMNMEVKVSANTNPNVGQNVDVTA